ncbi:MAG: hypothetical protein AAB692_01725 [Patescibacteria group bacterium]
MGEPNWADLVPPPLPPKKRRKEAPKPKAEDEEDEPLQPGEEPVVLEDLEAQPEEKTVEDKDIIESEDAEIADAGTERLAALQKLQIEQKQEAENKVIELDDQIAKKEAEMKLKFSQLDARTDRQISEQQKAVFKDVYDREIGKLKEMSGKLRERHGITEDVVTEDVEEIAETDADRQAEEKEKINKQLADAEAGIKALPRDRHSTIIKERLEASYDKVPSGWERAKTAIWKFGLSAKDKEFVRQYEELQKQKTEALKALTDFNAKPEEVMRMRSARRRGSEDASKALRPGKGRFSK